MIIARLNLNVIIGLIGLISYVKCYKILVFAPAVTRSHMMANSRIADTLASAGHDVTLFEPDFLNGLYSDIETTKVAKRWIETGFSNALWDSLQEFSEDAFASKSLLATVSELVPVMRAYNQLCRDLFNRDELMEKLRAEKYDAIFSEQINLCGHGVGKALGIKTFFWIVSCPLDEQTAYKLGLPIPYAYANSLVGYRLPKNPNFFQRAYNTLANFGYAYYLGKLDDELSDFYKEKFGHDFPNLSDISADSDLIFILTDEFLEVQKPEMPNFVHIGGLGFENDRVQKLDEVTSQEMGNGKNGIVYFSLGTTLNTSIQQPFMMHAVMDTVKAFPDYHFIIKVDQFDPHAWKFAEGLSNVFVTGWVDQRALLEHPRVKAYITHSGYNSIMESARAGVPLVMIPFMFDQARNTLAVEQTGWGVSVARESLRDDPKQLQVALKEVLENEKYRKSAMRLKNLIRTKPFSAKDRLVQMTEFVLDNGGMKELISPARHLSIIELYNIDYACSMLRRFVAKFARIMSNIQEAVLPETSAAAKEAASSALKITEDGNPARKSKVYKYAMMLCYQGQKYWGMQIQKDVPTIEGKLFEAMLKLGWITQENIDHPITFHFQRCARTDKHVSAARQIVGMHLPRDFDYEKLGPASLNEILPEDIRVLGMARATNLFHPHKMCNARTYSYTIPTYAFAKPHELTNSKFRITKETLEEIQSILNIYLGTHNFYNYTSGMVYEMNSCNRYIMSFECGEPFTFHDDFRNEDVEFLQITIKGQSFILHQIRKMIGMVIAVVRELQLKSYIQRSFENERLDVPKAPGLGLLLERVHFDTYDKKYHKTHATLSFWNEEVEEEAKRVKFELITKEMLESDIRQQVTLQWLASLAFHSFPTSNEDMAQPKNTFVTLANKQVALAKEEMEAKEAERSEEKEEVKEESKNDDEEIPAKRIKLEGEVEIPEPLENPEQGKEDINEEIKEEVKVAAGSG